MNTDLTTRLAEDAFSACRADFAREQGRALTPDEERALQKLSRLGIRWSETQPVSRFQFNGTYAAIFGVDRDQKREERKAKRQFRRYAVQHWGDDDGETLRENSDGTVSVSSGSSKDGMQFFIALLSAVAWHLMVVLIVRWLIKKYFENQVLAAQVCKG